MNLQAEKIELIKLITDIESERIIRKIKDILIPVKKNVKIEYPQEHLLTRNGMLVSEQALNDIWKNENDAEWAQYLNS